MPRTATHNRPNVNWHVPLPGAGWLREDGILAVLMDIREELRGINETLDCRNTRDISVRLKAIDRRLKVLEPKK